jgi:hypothetical protein
MGVNHPSIEALRPDHYEGIHATCDLAGQSKKGSVGEKERRTGNGRRRTGGTLENTASLE